MRLALTVAFIVTATVTASQPAGMLGTFIPRPIGNEQPYWSGPIGMSGECVGFVIARGVVSQADHEALEGFANIGDNFGLSMRPASPFYQRVLELRNKPVEVVLRPVPELTLERLR